MWFLRALIGILILSGLLYVALINTNQRVDIFLAGRGVPTFSQVELPVVLLGSFVLGVLVWFLVSLYQVLAAKAELAGLRRRNRVLTRELDDLRNLSVQELDPEALPAEPDPADPERI